MRGTDTRTVLAFSVMLVAMSQGMVGAQSPRRERHIEVFISAGAHGFSRFDDKGFGRHSDVGAGAALLVHPNFAVQVEADHVFGLDPAPCTENELCGATAVTASGLAILSTSRVQPYLMGGLLMLRSEGAGFQDPASATVARRTSDTGFGPQVGAGEKVNITRRFYVQPSFWAGTAVLMSRMNLSTSRASLAAGYRW
jgi:hypothetical protein